MLCVCVLVNTHMQAYKGIKSLLSAVLLSFVDECTGTNPFYAAMGFTPGTAQHAAAAGSPPATAAANEEVLASATIHLPQLVAAAAGSVDAAQVGSCGGAGRTCTCLAAAGSCRACGFGPLSSLA